MAEHDGRRERVRERFRLEGLDNFAPHEVLELLLFYSVRRGDTNVIAHDLIDTFGSIKGVLEASPDQLKTVKGIGDESAALLAMMVPMFRRYEMDKAAARKQIRSYEDAAAYCKALLGGLRVERFYVISLDVNGRVIAARLLGEGTINECAVPPRQVAEIALNHNAASVILCHNHPAGSR